MTCVPLWTAHVIFAGVLAAFSPEDGVVFEAARDLAFVGSLRPALTSAITSGISVAQAQLGGRFGTVCDRRSLVKNWRRSNLLPDLVQPSFSWLLQLWTLC